MGQPLCQSGVGYACTRLRTIRDRILEFYMWIKLCSQCADGATVHPNEGQQVYCDAPGLFS